MQVDCTVIAVWKSLKQRSNLSMAGTASQKRVFGAIVVIQTKRIARLASLPLYTRVEEKIAHEGQGMCACADCKHNARREVLNLEEEKDYKGVERDAEDIHDSASNVLWDSLGLDHAIGGVEHAHGQLEDKEHVVHQRLVLEKRGCERHGHEGDRMEKKRYPEKRLFLARSQLEYTRASHHTNLQHNSL